MRRQAAHRTMQHRCGGGQGGVAARLPPADPVRRQAQAVQLPPSAGSRPSPGRVLVLVRHPLLRRALSALVASDAGLTACGDALDVLDGVDAVTRLRPDLVITELPFDVFNGLALLRQIGAGHPGLPVLVVCWHDQACWADAAYQAGAQACVARHEIGARLPGLLRQALGVSRPRA